MAMYKRKAAEVEAITFDELVEHGRGQVDDVAGMRSMPWSFNYKGRAITHEDEDCYLIPLAMGGSERFERGDMLVTGELDHLHVCKRDAFAELYASADEPEDGPEDEKEANGFEWVGDWSVSGESKLLMLPSGDILRDNATQAEEVFHGEVVNLRSALRHVRSLAEIWCRADGKPGP